jgi:carbonic anhydrase
MGSLTTPPCGEGANGYVLNRPIPVGAVQVAQFAAAVDQNARPLQPVNNRLVLAPAMTQ